jgi:hypothetical protein
LIARQATYVGIDGGAVYGHPDPTLESISVATPAQSTAVTGSPEDIKAIEALVHSNPSEHVTEDVSFTNIFGTVRFGREDDRPGYGLSDARVERMNSSMPYNPLLVTY